MSFFHWPPTSLIVALCIQSKATLLFNLWMQMISRISSYVNIFNFLQNTLKTDFFHHYHYHHHFLILLSQSLFVLLLRRCDRKMLRYMTGVRWQDGRSSSEVTEMCGVEDLSVNFKLRQRRLRWFDMWKGQRGCIGWDGGVDRRQSAGRPRKKRS